MDILADVFAATRFGEATTVQFRPRRPWGVHYDAEGRAGFHAVLRGSCWVVFEDERAAVRLEAGDMLLVPHGWGHGLAGAPETPLMPFREWCNGAKVAPVPPSSGPDETLIMCGGYPLETEAPHPLLALLPQVIHIPRRAYAQANDVAAILRLLELESKGERLGAAAIRSRLFDALFMYAIRHWVESRPDEARTWVEAMHDPTIGHAVALIHRRPHEEWTVDSLAHEVALSRAAFSRRFTSTIGEPPLTYLTRWRMSMASRLLRETSQTLARIAATVGYQSEHAFSKAFRRERGVPPGHYRDQRPSS